MITVWLAMAVLLAPHPSGVVIVGIGVAGLGDVPRGKCFIPAADWPNLASGRGRGCRGASIQAVPALGLLFLERRRQGDD